MVDAHESNSSTVDNSGSIDFNVNVPLGFWPSAVDTQPNDVHREPIAVVAPGGAISRGIIWSTTPRARIGILLAHPRTDFSIHYLAAPLARLGFQVLGMGTRYVNSDTELIHENCVIDVALGAAALRERGAEVLIALGNSGGSSLMALAHIGHQVSQSGAHDAATYSLHADGFVSLAAHPGEGVFLAGAVDPSVTDEADMFSVDPTLNMYDPQNGWRPWPEPSTYDRGWLSEYRAAQQERVKRIDQWALNAQADRVAARTELQQLGDPTTLSTGELTRWSAVRARTIAGHYRTIFRTLADPAYLDPTIEPDDRPMGSIFAQGDPLVANYGIGGMARNVSDRAWLSTWSSNHSSAQLSATLPDVKIPTLIMHPTADTEVRISHAQGLRDASGADDVTYEELIGVNHYLHGHRLVACQRIHDWITRRFGPSIPN